MANKLKTLEDLNIIYDLKESAEWINKKSIKAEAVKWVKAHFGNYLPEIIEDASKRAFIEFFNLTEEDLK